MAGESTNYIMRTIIETKGAEESIRKITKYQKVSEQGNKKIARSYTFADGKLKGITESVKSFTPKAQKASQQTGNLARKTGDLAKQTQKAAWRQNDFVKALRRVAIVVPVWLLARGALMGVIRTISMGAKYWMEFDKAMMKTKAVIHGAVKGIDSTMEDLETTIRDMAQNTGESMDKLASTFYRFGTVGLEYETSVQGMKAANDMAIAMFGNVDSIARMLAESYRLLGKSMDSTVPKNRQLQAIASDMYILWKKNAFEIDGMTESLRKFLPTASSLGISLQESIVLLSALNTAGIKAGRAGRLLRTSYLKMVENFDQIADSVGYTVKSTDTFFDVLVNVIGKLEELERTTGKLGTSKALKEIFGGIRSQESIRALTQMRDLVIENAKALELPMGEKMEMLKDRVEDINDSVSRQVQISGELRKQLGRSFVEGIAGGDGFADSLKRINEWLKTAIPAAKAFAEALTEIPVITAIMNREIKEAVELASELSQFERVRMGELNMSEIKSMISEIKEVQKLRQEQARIPGFLEPVKREKLFQYDIFSEEDLENQLKVLQKFLKKAKEEAIQAEKDKLKASEDERRKQSELRVQKSKEEYAKIAKAIIASELKIAKTRGASGVQLAEMKIQLDEMYNIGQEELEVWKKKLDLEEKITEEKEKQNQFGDEAIKLMKIGMKYGKDTAEVIAEFLRGGITSEDFFQKRMGRMGREAQVYLKEFGRGALEQEQAREFFGGRGKGIRIEEREKVQLPGRRIQEPTMPRMPTRWEIADKLTIGDVNDLRINAQSIRIFGKGGEAVEAPRGAASIGKERKDYPRAGKGQGIIIPITIKADTENTTGELEKELASKVASKLSLIGIAIRKVIEE